MLTRLVHPCLYWTLFCFVVLCKHLHAPGWRHQRSLIDGVMLMLCRQPAEILQMERREAEACLEFVGLALLANPIRTDSREVILSLQAAHIRTAMVTGDHVHTAIAVARQCGLLPAKRQAAPASVFVMKEQPLSVAENEEYKVDTSPTAFDGILQAYSSG